MTRKKNILIWLAATRTNVKSRLMVLTFLLAMTDPAGALQPTYWQAGSGDWSNNHNWNGGEPQSMVHTFIDNGGTALITQAEVCGNLELTNGHVEMSSGGSLVTTNVCREFIGGTYATFTQTGGVNDTHGLSIGAGTYELSGDGRLFVGEDLMIAASSTFDQSGGINRINFDLSLNGTYNLSGTGELSVLWNDVHIGGYGAFTQCGGTHTIENGNLYIDSMSGGTYELSGGELSVQGNEYVGYGDTGTFIQSGGTHTVENTLCIACLGDWEYLTASVGTYGLTGGTLSAGTIEFGAGTGTFNFGGGRLSVETFKGDLYNHGGTLAPGSSTEIATIEGDYEQLSTCALEIELGGLNVGTFYDKLVVTGALALNGTLDVVLINGFSPQEGDAFDILDFNPSQFTGWFSTVNLPALPTGLFWDTDALYSTGEISVQSTDSLLNLLSPVGGETLIAGSTCSIIWDSDPSISHVVIEYSTDYGITWTQVDPPNIGNSGGYNWVVPSVASTQCLVWISDADRSGVFDASDTVFTIREPDPACGLIGKWSGDGNARDSVGGNHGLLMNGATFAPGNVGQAFSFDGVDDYVHIPYDPRFNLSSFTLQAWVKFTQDTYACIISRPGTSFFHLANPHGWISGAVKSEQQDYASSVSTGRTTFNDSEWHMCTFVRDVDAGPNGGIRIYVDGVSTINWYYANSSPGDMEHNLSGIYIGSCDGSKWFFKGVIDEVEIYNLALDGGEIWDMFLASVGGSVLTRPSNLLNHGTMTAPTTMTTRN